MGRSSGWAPDAGALLNVGQRPTGALAAAYDMRNAGTAISGAGTGILRLQATSVSAGRTLTSISFLSGTTGATNPTAQWFGLWDASRGKLSVTLDDAATAWAATDYKTLKLARWVTDAVCTNASAVITSATAVFTPADIGKSITFLGAGAAGASLGTTAADVTIASVESATSATMSTTASTSVAANGKLGIATPYVPAVGFVYVGINMTAATPISYMGISMANGSALGDALPLINGNSTTGLTDATTAPSTAATITSSGAVGYFYVS